jgi:hypothetical protein
VAAVVLIGSETLKDDDLQLLAPFSSLTGLYLGQTSITGVGLHHLAGLKNLKTLGLIGTKVTDQGLRGIDGLESLQELYLSDTAITDAGLKKLAKLKTLRELLLGATAVTDRGLRELEMLENLAALDLSETKISDAGLKELAKLKKLRVLSLGGTAITEKGLKEIGSFPSLRVLDLSKTELSDAGLRALGTLKDLQILRVIETKVSDTAVKELQDAVPDLRIVRQALAQRADPDFDVSIAHPAYKDKHPSVLFDEAHKNFHTASGRYKVFADLITNDGYRVVPNKESFTPERLAGHAILVIANASADSGAAKSAFTTAECDSVQNWVKAGGALLLITDHEPFGSASDELGKRFGVEMSLRVTADAANETQHGLLFSRDKNQLGDHPIMTGRDESERVDRVLTFTGQSLLGPPGSAALLKFANTAKESGKGKEVSAAGRAQGVALKDGRGRVVVLGEAAQLSAQVYGDPPEPMGMNVPGCDNRKMALNVMHWLSGLTN